MRRFALVFLTALIVRPGAAADVNPLARRISIEPTRDRELVELCCALRLTCAIEIDVRGDDHGGDFLKHERYLDMKAETALRLMMRHYPDHVWKYNDGLLTVQPRRSIAKNPIDAPFGPITLKHSNPDDIIGEISPRANLQTLNREPSLYRRPPRGRVDFSSPNATVRELFSAVVRQYGEAAWYVRHEISWRRQAVAVADLITYDNALCSLPKDPADSDETPP